MKQPLELLTPMEDSDIESPTADHTLRCIFDREIRKCGYRIKSRPNRGETTWERGGVEFTQSDVLLREGID